MMASTASLSPCTTLSTPAGSPASSNSLARKTEALGSFSLGLSRTVLPQAMADAVIHSGTMIGKLNGVIAATTPTGCLTEWTSTPRATCSERSPLSRWDESGGELDVLDAAADLALGVGEHLAVLAGDDRGELVLPLDQQFADPEEDVGALGQAGGPPSGQGGAGGRDGFLDRAAEASATSFSCSPVAGLKTGP